MRYINLRLLTYLLSDLCTPVAQLLNDSIFVTPATVYSLFHGFSSIRTAVAPSLSLDQQHGTCSIRICMNQTCKLTVFVVHWRCFFLISTRHIERIRGVFATMRYINWPLHLHHCEHASDALPLPISRRWSPLASLYRMAPAPHCEATDMGWSILQCACLLPQFMPGTHSSLSQRVGLSRPRCLVLCRDGLPVKDGHPPRH